MPSAAKTWRQRSNIWGCVRAMRSRAHRSIGSSSAHAPTDGLSDLREAAEALAGRKVAASVRAWVVPGSEAVKRAAEREGLHRKFLDAGFEWREPGCSMCLGANGDIIAPGERSVSTTNRNFVGRQGPGARTHLASPTTAVAAAVAGHIADIRKLGH